MPSMDFMYFKTDIYTAPTSIQYWESLYYSAMVFALSDMFAASTIELAYISCMNIICTMMTANIFGMIAILAEQMSEKSQKFQQ